MKALNRITFLFFLFVLINKTHAQVGIGINPPDPSAMLHVQATDKGILIPRMTEAQRIAIQNPAEGLEVYQTNNTKGFWYFTDGQWKSLASPGNNGGKHTLYLADNITDAQAAAKIATDVGPNTQEIRIIRCTNLTTVDLSMLTNPTEIYISGNTVLQSVNIDNVQSVDGGIYIDQCPAFTTLSISNLQGVGQSVFGVYGFQLSASGLVNLSLPLVSRINGTIKISDNAALTSVSCPQLTNNTLINISGNTNLTSALFPLLNTVGTLTITNNKLSSLNFPVLSAISVNVWLHDEPVITSVSCPALLQTPYLRMENNTLLASLSFPALKKVTGALVINNNDALTTVPFPVLDSTSGALTISNNQLLSSISFPVLVKSGQLGVNDNPALSSISMPVLNRLSFGANAIYNNTVLPSFSLPALVTSVGGFQVFGNSNLTAISFDALTSLGVNGTSTYYNNNKLPSAGVNYILHKLVTAISMPNTGIYELKQIPAAPPTGQGIIDKTTLENGGAIIITD